MKRLLLIVVAALIVALPASAMNEGGNGGKAFTCDAYHYRVHYWEANQWWTCLRVSGRYELVRGYW